ncbi:MAG: 2Fe-2S iron-sulfur cluster-binding protein [Rhodoferax sp.]|uniref:2Fe-2S iron-sulfur cluster-binding protein n=1 Tax=Rhodoferax sp. TaxID=50421 RepID=UPI0027159269|nr:2Fe-2S iron-sulfur cluster-binding protein [Rhodoferax sp.]MDO8447361.1 2Fe-2S iron-sulfur cluster-binding protein [Rhodoferax sp.]
MSHQVSVWRAAQLVGVARGVLQQQVRAGALVLSDGLVSTDALLRLYPGAKMEESGLLERVAQIRDEAFGRRVRERMLPSQEVLAQRLFAQSQELADVRKHLQRYHSLVIELQQRIRELAAERPGDATWLALEQQLTQGLAQALATESVDLLEVMDDMLKVMTAQVTVRPSGHEFSVEGHANLLQSGLHAGLKLNYGCGNGSCGMCKVRVISGEVVKTQHYDYPLSEAEKAQGYTLMCCHTAASSELTLEMLEASGPQDIPEQHIVTQVRAVTELAPDTRLLHLQTPRTHRLRFLAGQSVSLGWTTPGQGDAHATYPVASCPCDDRNLLFFVSRDESDGMARHLFAGDIKPGAAVTVLGPTGEFVLADGHRPLVFAACDAGFAPIKSLIEHALSLDASPSLSLFWLATRSDGHFLGNQCRAWSQALDQFEYELVSHADVIVGARQIAQAMRADLFDIDCDFYLSGPPDFVTTLHDELRAVGVAAAQIFTQVL